MSKSLTVGDIWQIPAKPSNDDDQPALATVSRPGGGFEVAVTKTDDGGVVTIAIDEPGDWAVTVDGDEHTATVAALDEPTADELPKPPSQKSILDEVGDDVEKAAAHLEAEQARGDAARAPLIAKLEAIIAG